MKKILCYILAVVVCFSLSACSFGNTDNSIVGTWEGEVFGMEMVYIFKSNGTYENFISSMSASGTSGSYIYNSSTQILKLDPSDKSKSELKVTITGDTMILRPIIEGDTSMDVIYKRVD